MEDKEDIIQVVTATMEAREDTTLTMMATKEDKVATILVEEEVKEGREDITLDKEAKEDKVDTIRVEMEAREGRLVAGEVCSLQLAHKRMAQAIFQPRIALVANSIVFQREESRY